MFLKRAKFQPGLVACCVALLISCALILLPTQAFATPTSSEVQAEADVALASLNTMQEQLDEATNNYYLAVEEQEEAEANCDAAQLRIDEANEEIAELQSRLSVRAWSMYRTGSSSFLDLLLGATSFTEFSTAWDLLTAINEEDAELVAQTKALREEVEEQMVLLEEQEALAIEKAEEAKEIQDTASDTVDAMQATYDSLSAEVAQLIEEERAAEEAAAEAAAQAALEAAAQAEAEEQAQAEAEAENSTSDDSSNSDSSSSDSSTSTSDPAYSATTGNAIVDRALSCLGCDYEWAAVGPNTFDCSGLVSYAISGSYTRVGTTYTFMTYTQVSDPQPGDICVNTSHCGIYIGNGQMVHASTYGVGVIIGSVYSNMIYVRA